MRGVLLINIIFYYIYPSFQLIQFDLQKEETLPTLELRHSKTNRISALIVWAGIMCYMAYDMRKELFKWNNPGVPNTLIFLLFFSIGIVAVINIFDKRPQVIIERKGIWKRKYLLPFSPLVCTNWKEMQYFYLLQKTEKGIKSFNLVIRNRDTEKDIKVGLITDYSSIETIMSLVRRYAEKYGIHDLGEEIS